jgi:uncharacterized protein (TIRG00374 family)
MTAPGETAAPRSRRRLWWALARVVLGAALLAVVFFKVDWRTLANALGRISLWHVVAAYLFYVLSVVFKAFRWQRLGVMHRHVTALDCFSATANGFLFGLLAPGMFEFTRAYVLKKRARVPFGSVLGIIVAERALDTVLLVATIFVVLVLVPAARWLSIVAVALAVLTIVGLGLLVLLVSTRHRSVLALERALSRLSPRLARHVAGFLGHFAEGLHSLGRLGTQGVISVVVLAVLLWAARGCYVLFAFRSLDLGGELGFASVYGIALVIAAVEYLGMLVKLTPAGIGQYQVVTVAVLVAFGIGQTIAASASIVLHAVRIIMIFSLGLPFLYREHLGMSRLRQEKAVGEQDTGSAGTGPAA